MEYCKFGRTGIEISDIAPGLWGMGGWSGSDDEQSLEALQLSVDLGCHFFDTAWAYGEGKSDGLLGQTIAKNKGKRLYAASKIPPKNQRWPAQPSYKYHDVFPSDHVFKYADLIRKRLGTDSIDLLQFHVWTDEWIDEPDFRRTVERLKRDGTIHYFGLSLNRWEPENGIKAIRSGLVDTVQVIYSIFDQSPEDELFPLCQELNIGVIVRVALDEGSLGGKMTKKTKILLQRLAVALLQSRKPSQHVGARGQAQTNLAGRNLASGDGAALRFISSCGRHHDCRNEEIPTCPRELRVKRQRSSQS